MRFSTIASISAAFLVLLATPIIAHSAEGAPDTIHFKGMVGTNMAIDMTLRVSGNEVSGTYFYVKHNTDIRLKGEKSNQDLKLNEFDENGNISGQFTGKFVSASKVEGQWSKPDGSRSLPFAVETTQAIDTQASPPQLDKDLASAARPAEKERQTGDPAPSGTAAQDTSDLQTVEAKGVGESEDAALKDAFSNAVQSAVGTMVDAETLIKNDKVMKDQVLTYSNAFIQKFDKIGSEKRADGLYEVRIKAQVQRKQLVEKLKAANITEKEVKTSSLYAQVVTQNKEEKDAKAILAKALQDIDYPACMLVARISAEEPKLVAKNEKSATIEWPVEIRVDEDAYFNKVLPKLKEALDGVAKEKSGSDALVSAKASEKGLGCNNVALGEIYRDPSLSPRGKDGYPGHLKKNEIGLVVKKNSSGDNLRIATFTLDSDAYDSFWNWVCRPQDIHGPFPSLLVLRMAWLDGTGNPVIEEDVRIFENKCDIMSYGVSQGGFQGFVKDQVGGGVGIRLGPFVYLPSCDYFGAYQTTYQREVSLDDLKKVVKMQCTLVSRTNGAAKPE